MYYFAYASNMSHDQMLKVRCPGSKFIGPARLSGHWFVFDGFSADWGGAVGNIVPSSQDEVWGGVFEVTENQLQVLDSYEACPRFCSRQLFDVERRAGQEKLKAWGYIRVPQPAGFPSKKYMSTILRGAKDCRLPADYVQSSLKVHVHELDEPAS